MAKLRVRRNKVTQELEPPWSGIRQKRAAFPEAEQRASERLVRVQTHEPTEQQVGVELLSQHPLGANAVDRLQQQDQQQLLWRNRGPTTLGIRLAEGGVEPIKSLIHLGAAVLAWLDTPAPSAEQRGET